MTASLHQNAAALDEVLTLIRLVEGARRGYQNLAAGGVRVPGRQVGLVVDSLNAALVELVALREELTVGAGR